MSGTEIPADGSVPSWWPGPGLAKLQQLSASRQSFARMDASLAAFMAAVGGTFDPSDPEAVRHCRVWLNKWVCRIGYPRTDSDVFVDELVDWAESVDLPVANVGLLELSGGDIERVARAYEDLSGRTACVFRSGRRRTFGPTAASKVLYAVRPLAVAPWDRRIALRSYGRRDATGFAMHMRAAQAWADRLVRECDSRGLAADEIPVELGRPLSSLPKLLDEWLYHKVSRGR